MDELFVGAIRPDHADRAVSGPDEFDGDLDDAPEDDREFEFFGDRTRRLQQVTQSLLRGEHPVGFLHEPRQGVIEFGARTIGKGQRVIGHRHLPSHARWDLRPCPRSSSA